MRLKYYIMVFVSVITFSGFLSEAAGAEEGIIPWFRLWTWSAYDYRDKNWEGGSNPGGLEAEDSRADRDIYMGLGSSDTQFGIKLQRGSIKVMASVSIGDNPDIRGVEKYFTRPMFAEFSINENIKLLGGFDGSPYASSDSNDVAAAEKNKKSGGMDDAVSPMIKLTFFDGYALISRPVIENKTYNNDDPLSDRNTDSLIPKLAAGYTFRLNSFSIMVNGVFQTYKIDSPDVSGTYYQADGKAITAYAVNTIFKGQFEKINFYMHAFYGQNTGDLAVGSLSGSRTMAQISGDKIVNTMVYGGNAGIAFYMDPKLLLAAGACGDIADNSDFKKKDMNLSTYLSLAYTLTSDFKIVPEVKIVDKMKNEQNIKEGKQFRAGISFRVDI
ncbi:MAG: hypothetical protein JW864_02620 [Spirochaetes bacterium]|nr:hypothetical protein [Spirochaetota bacterium]